MGEACISSAHGGALCLRWVLGATKRFNAFTITRSWGLSRERVRMSKGFVWYPLSGSLLNQQCSQSWRDAELGVPAVCVVGDTTDEDRWVDMLCCSPYRDTADSCLMNDALTTFNSSSDSYDDWRRPSPTIRCPSYDASSSFRRCRLLYSVVPSRPLLSAWC